MQTTSRREISVDCWRFLREVSRNLKITDAVLTDSTAELPLEYLLTTQDDFTIDQLQFNRNECAIPRGSRPLDGFTGEVFHIEPIGRQSRGCVWLRSSSSTNSGCVSADEVTDRKWKPETRTRPSTLVERHDLNEFLFSRHPLAHQLMSYKRFSMNTHTAIVCPRWPREAFEWTTRKRPYGWPSETLVESVTANGCHLVPCTSEKQHGRNAVFRYCFSVPEAMLVKTWTPVQKYIYHILLLIKSDVVRQLKTTRHESVIDSYHFKTLMLWASESRPVEFWEKGSIKASIGELLCKMIQHLIERSCPNYFIPSDNLLEHLPEGVDLEAEIAALLVYREQGASRLAASMPMTDPTTKTTFLCSSKVLNFGYLGIGSVNLQPWDRISKAPIQRRKLDNLPDPLEFADLYAGVMEHLRLASNRNRSAVKVQSESETRNVDDTKAAIRLFELAMTRIHEEMRHVSFCFSDSLPDILSSVLKVSNGVDTSLSNSTLKCTQDSNESDSKPLDSDETPPAFGENQMNCIKNGKQENSVEFYDGPVQRRTNVNESEQLQNDEKCSSLQAILGLCLNAILPSVSAKLPKATYFLSAAYRANFYFTYLKNHRTALRVCEEASRHTRDTEFQVVSHFKDQSCSLVLSQRFMPIFDEHIQTVYGFVTLSQMLVSTRKKSGKTTSASTISYPIPSAKLSQHLSPVDFLKYVKFQCEKQVSSVSLYCQQEEWRRQFCSKRRSTFRLSEILYAALKISASDNGYRTHRSHVPFWYCDDWQNC